MKKVILMLFLFSASAVMAGGQYILLWLRHDTPASDKVAVRDELYSRCRDRTKIDVDSLPVWRVIANTNITGWGLVIHEKNLDLLGVDPDTVTEAAFDAWKNANLSAPNKLKVARGDDWRIVLATNKLEEIPEPEWP